MVWPIIAGMTLAVMLGRGSGIVNGWGGLERRGRKAAEILNLKFEIGETVEGKSNPPCANTAHGAPTNANANAQPSRIAQTDTARSGCATGACVCASGLLARELAWLFLGNCACLGLGAHFVVTTL